MIADARKRCGKCGEDKPRSEYHRNRSKRDGLHDYCKPCQLAAVRKNQNRHGKHILNRSYRYGLTKEEVHVFLQIPCCQSCGMEFGGRPPHFDHCHENGHVRGAICGDCNAACRGLAVDAVTRLKSCIDYLTRDLERFSEQG